MLAAVVHGRGTRSARAIDDGEEALDALGPGLRERCERALERFDDASPEDQRATLRDITATLRAPLDVEGAEALPPEARRWQIGRASCRERV